MSAWPWRRQLHTCWSGALLLAVASCSGSGGNDPSIIADISLGAESVTLDATGQNLQLTATVQDENGDPISGAQVDWDSENPSVVTVSESGLLVGQLPGTTNVTASVGEVSATVIVAVASVSSVRLLEGNGQTAIAGEAVTTAPAVRVRDASDQPVANVRVRFQAGTASGTVTGETQLTGEDGIARVGSWRVGSAGVNTLTASVEDAEVANEPVEFLATTAKATGYDITVHYLGEYTSTQLRAFAEAELRWESHITGDLLDVNQTLPANSCGNNPETPGPFDDLTIFVTLQPIDGPFGVLGQAGPCFVRDPGDLTVVGRMQFDTDDVELLETEGSLSAVILHEMGHVLGFGTLWTEAGLLEDPSVPDPEPPLADTHFTGPQAIAAFDAAGGTTYTGAKVPVMNIGSAGTVNSHWRDEVFDPEVMTGFLNDGFNPLSAVTIRSLQDLGYSVSITGADPFTLTPAFRVAGSRRGRELVDDIISDPIRRIDANGRIIGVIRR
jgi:hypothetical protein